MRKTDQPGLVNNLQSGDIGLILSNNFFSTLQNWYRVRMKEGPARASHGFLIETPPKICEANGLFISEATILKNIGDKTKCWVFRYPKITPNQVSIMEVFASAAKQVGGHYSVGGIFQFARSFVKGKADETDEGGVFCTEFTSDIIKEAGLPYMEMDSWKIDPSTQLNWFLSPQAATLGWLEVGCYDGAGNYFIN